MSRWTYGLMTVVSTIALACGDDGEADRARTQVDGGMRDPAGSGALDGGTGTIDAGTGAAPDAGRPTANDPAPVDRTDPPGTQLVDDLTPEQDLALCQKMSARAKEVIEKMNAATCTITGLLVAEQRPGTCSDVRDGCMAEQVPDEVEDVIDCSEHAGLGSCPGLTVAEMEACTAWYQARVEEIASFTCRSAAADVRQALDRVGMGGSECQVVSNKCGAE